MAYLAFILNGLIFILIGLQLPSIVHGLKYYSVQEGIRYGLVISVLIILIRLIWLFATTYIPVLPSKKLGNSSLRPNWKEVFLVGWAGMRGVISLASALAIPEFLADGSEFPERDLVLFVSFVVILVTLVFQGLSLPWIIKKLNFDEDKPEVPAVIQSQQIHLLLVKLSIDRLEEKYAGLLESNILVKNLRLRFEAEGEGTRINIASLTEHSDEKLKVNEYNRVVHEISEFLNRQLTLLRLQDVYDEDVIRREESRIDLEQNKID